VPLLIGYLFNFLLAKVSIQQLLFSLFSKQSIDTNLQESQGEIHGSQDKFESVRSECTNIKHMPITHHKFNTTYRVEYKYLQNTKVISSSFFPLLTFIERF
jgi:hypothetical protein